MNKHLMLDLETLDTRPTAAFQQVGWAIFDPQGKGAHQSGCFFVDVKSCLYHGLTMDWETIQWWMRQPDESRKLLQTKGQPLSQVLLTMAEEFNKGNFNGVWSHGATFDLPILNNAFSAVGLRPPWSHKICFDTRTLFMLRQPAWDNNTVKHSAESDAISQVSAVQSSFKQIYGKSA